MSEKLKAREIARNAAAISGAAIGGAGVGLQNYLAVTSLTSSGGSIIQGLLQAGGAVGAGAGAAANFLFNYDLLRSFFDRITGKKKRRKPLPVWRQIIRFVGGVLVVMTGLMFGGVSFAFGMSSPLAILGIVAGVAVAGVTTIQELETWLQNFDKEEEEEKTLAQLWQEWWDELTWRKAVGYFIALMNSLALCLTFAIGLTVFFSFLGMPAMPALIAGFVSAFTAGLFTEMSFYGTFLGGFCANISQRWSDFKNTKWTPVGATVAVTNALINGVLMYAAVGMLTAVVVAAGIAAPPLGVIIGVGVVCAVFATVASLILGVNFWTDGIGALFPSFKKFVEEKTGSLLSDHEHDKDNNKDNDNDYSKDHSNKNNSRPSASTGGEFPNITVHVGGKSLIKQGRPSDGEASDASLEKSAATTDAVTQLAKQLPEPPKQEVGTSHKNIFKDSAQRSRYCAKALPQSSVQPRLALA